MKRLIFLFLFSSFMYASQYERSKLVYKINIKEKPSKIYNIFKELEGRNFNEESKKSTFKDFIISKFKKAEEKSFSNQFKMESEYDIDLMPVRNFLNTISKCQVGEIQIFPMIDENIYVTYDGCDGNRNLQTYIVSINPEGEWELFIADPNTTWLSHTIEPISKTPASLCSKRVEGYDYYWISAQTFDSNYICISPIQCSWAFQPTEIAFDKLGNLYILANRWHFCVPDNEKKYCLWKFAPGQRIWLDPNNSNSLTPGGLSGIAYELYVSGSGTIHYIAMSPIHPSPVTDLAVNCDGATYHSEYGRNLKGYYGEQRYFVINNYGSIYDVKLNEYGEIFVLLPDLIHIVLEEELPEGWYLCQLCKYPGEEGFSKRASGPSCKSSEGEIVLYLDRDQSLPDNSLVTLDKNNTNADILFGERPKISAYWMDKNDKKSPLSVEWQLTEKNVSSDPTNISNKSLFKDTPVLLFTDGASPYKNQTLDFQTVHTGSIKLQVTSKEEKEGTLEVEIKIKTPSSLGNAPNNFDSEITKYAHKYGIPPQYLKAHINKEAKKENGLFISDSFRYEPLSLDIGTQSATSGGLLKGIWSWTRAEWLSHYADYDSFHFPDGSLISYELYKRIYDFYKITEIIENIDNPDVPTYHCSMFWDLAEIPNVVDIYNANNGWAEGSYPSVLYNSNGPCSGRRQNWDTKTFGGRYYLVYHNSKYYCTGTNIPEQGCEPVRCAFIQWFYNNPFTYAQVPIASTYGIMQVWYITAVEKLKWNRGMESAYKEPSLLLDLFVSLDLGASFDADSFGKKGIKSAKNFDSFFDSIKTGLELYNDGRGYADSILNTVNLFKPKI